MDRDQLTAIAAKRGRPSDRALSGMSVATVRAVAQARWKRHSSNGTAVASLRPLDADQLRKIAKLHRGAGR